MTRRKTWEVDDERKLRRSIQTSEDYQNESYHQIFLSAGWGYGTMTESVLNDTYPTRYVDDGNDQYNAWSFSMPDNWQSGLLNARIFARPASATSGNCYTRIFVQYQPSDTSGQIDLIDSYEAIPMTAGVGFRLYEHSVDGDPHDRDQRSNNGEHVVGVRLERISTNVADTLTSTRVHFVGVLLTWKPETYRV
jgi:hypothetical protein